MDEKMTDQREPGGFEEWFREFYQVRMRDHQATEESARVLALAAARRFAAPADAELRRLAQVVVDCTFGTAEMCGLVMEMRAHLTALAAPNEDGGSNG